MALRVAFSRRELRKLYSITEYLETAWGIDVAKSFVKSFFSFAELLSLFPNLGAIVNPKNLIRAFHFKKYHQIYYKIKSNKVVILNVIDNRQFNKST